MPSGDGPRQAPTKDELFVRAKRQSSFSFKDEHVVELLKLRKEERMEHENSQSELSKRKYSQEALSWLRVHALDPTDIRQW
eukprot:CAMPEP_0167773832 /NCGR_PEP_ID=MMETSP0111_2-20121227/1656_1 /TAXON_ID=91324 /ORGANISM="Lotharella globosa, Strain CCCM811" /LENGTH=80 /DNA_ID=CAMNT_0007663547 /DNA_START=59 /DNA_END=298 /DNA_ORIENTATION=-